MTTETQVDPVLAAFRARFVRNPEVNELTPLGFFAAGAEWQARQSHEQINAAEEKLLSAGLQTQQTRVLLAWYAATLSEGQACALLRVDRVVARGMLNKVLADVEAAWGTYRAEHPVGESEPA